MIQRTYRLARILAVAIPAMLSVMSHAQDPSIVAKNHLYNQTTAGTAVDFPVAPYVFKAQAAGAGYTLHLPGGATATIPYDSSQDSYELDAAFATKAALDAAYPNGTYTLTATGSPTLTFNVTTDQYPTSTPQITGGTWNAGGVYVVDPTQVNTVNVSTFSTYASAGVAGHESFDVDTDNSNFSKEIATQAVFGLTASATPFTSVSIPANTFNTGKVYQARLQFDTLTTLDTSGNGTVALFGNHLEFWIAALAPGTAALPIPTISAQPANRTASLGGSATFTFTPVLGNVGTQIVQMRWYLNGLELPIFNNTKYTQGFNSGTFSLTINNVTSADFGNYTVKVIDTGGIVTSNIATLTQAASSVPTITSQPQGHNLATGSSVVFTVAASGGNLTYQWRKNGGVIAGAVGSQYFISNAQPSDGGSYSVTVTNSSGSVTSNGATLGVSASGDPGRLVNASVRIVSGTAANVLIVGFVTGGTGTSGSKTLLIRGVGPTLTGFGVPGAMADPLLEIIPGGGSVATVSNDNWAGDATVTSTGNAVGAFALPSTTSKDSALVTSLAAGVYSAKVSGVGSTTGTVLAELYDANPTTYSASTPRIINLSARAPMANDNPLIAGFVIGGSTAKTLMVRAIGPYLTQFFGASAMADPTLELYVSQNGNNTLVTTNDNWAGSTLLTTTGNSVGAFALTDVNSKDAVLLITLDPGVYSAKVLGINNASGITLVEIYEIP